MPLSESPGQGTPPDVDRDTVVISDPRAIRALAHPARVTTLHHLYAGEVLTATECARLAGLTPSAMSYHLRALERWGLVRRAEAQGDGRERPWRAAAESMRVNSTHSPEARTAAGMLLGSLVDALRLDADKTLAQNGEAIPPAPIGFTVIPATLTEEEGRALNREVIALLERHAAEASHGPGSRRHHLYWAGLPVVEAVSNVGAAPGVEAVPVPGVEAAPVVEAAPEGAAVRPDPSGPSAEPV